MTDDPHSTTQLWVHDQDEALAFWQDKVGFKVRQDVTVPEMGNFRWLTVSPKGQEDRRQHRGSRPSCRDRRRASA